MNENMEHEYPKVIRCKKFNDKRGSFCVSFNNDLVPGFKVVQQNYVENENCVFRGLHWQEPPYAQAKLVRALKGAIIDFAVDIRKGSPTFGKMYYEVLEDPYTWFYIPRGFAHGYITFDCWTKPIVEYLVDNEYSPMSERGVFITRDVLNTVVKEVCDEDEIIINDKDLNWPQLNDIETQFEW